MSAFLDGVDAALVGFGRALGVLDEFGNPVLEVDGDGETESFGRLNGRRSEARAARCESLTRSGKRFATYGAYRDRTGDLRLAKALQAFPDVPL